uniref:Ribosomal protein S7 n=1 Tax=Achlya hypogyna TaxID=1202772 RepID=S5TRQ0_ACHHY|nr:ribosomal protein S7 [Achlya hypogyna]YP_008475371.1 ribosomal protein S7 [Achlya hypogyna]AGS55481.1 ribosomal protein S7 [Achlya hypogyna]AGS55482.1 ribosomal protein S7 [Achlya hypogyna]
MELNDQNNQIRNSFIKMLLKKGKKSIAENLYNNILIELRKKTKQKPIFILIKTIDILAPKLKLINVPVSKRKTRKKKNKYFLMFLNKEKQIKDAINWLLFYSRKRKANFLKNIINEILGTFNHKSKSIIKRDETYIEIQKLRYNIKFNTTVNLLDKDDDISLKKKNKYILLKK